jgi:hypothetical protein
MRAAAALAAVLLLGVSVRAGGEAGYEPVFREGRPGDVLVRGEPSLLRGDLDAFVDMTQAAFDVAIDARREQALRDALETGFGAAAAPQRQAFLDVVRPVTGLREKARQSDREGVRQGFESFRRAIDQRLLDLPRSVASRVLGEVLTRRHDPVWKGVPEIHGVAADAWVETATFVASLALNLSVEPTPGQVEALYRDLDAALRGKGPDVRERLLRAHRTWLNAKARWLASTEAKRFEMRWEAVLLLARALPPGAEPPHEVRRGAEMTDYAREAGTLAQKIGAYDALSNLARNPEALLGALERGLGVPRDPGEDILLYP